MTTDYEWATKYWGQKILSALKEGELLDFLPFVIAACKRKGLGEEISDAERRRAEVEKKARTILAYDVAPLIKSSRLTPNAEFWKEFVEAVFKGVERIVIDRARPMTYAPVTLEPPDRVPSVEETYEREQEERLPQAPEKALREGIMTMDRLISAINERMLQAKWPIYSLMKKHPRRHEFLWGLLVALFPNLDLFEALVEAYSGASVKVPMKADYRKAERVRKVLQLRHAGLTQVKIASRLHTSQPLVHQLLKDEAASRRPEMEMERALLKALNKALNCQVKATSARKIRSL